MTDPIAIECPACGVAVTFPCRMSWKEMVLRGGDPVHMLRLDRAKALDQFEAAQTRIAQDWKRSHMLNDYRNESNMKDAVTGQQEFLLVPRVPTPEMLEAAWAYTLDEDAEGMWTAMLKQHESSLVREVG